METIKFILKPGIKSVYCNGLDKHIYGEMETDDQKIIGELCLTNGVYLVGTKQHKEMLKDQERLKVFRANRDKAEAEAKKLAEEKAEAEAKNMTESEKAFIEGLKPVGAEKAKVDEIKAGLEKEIAKKKKR